MSIGRVPGVTGIQPSIVDAKGDLIVATAADSVDRLAVGSANQVLTVDSSTATGLKWAAPSTPTYVGCSVQQSGPQTIPNSTDTILNWNVETTDSDGFHSNTTNNSRITIPTGKGGKYLVGSIVAWASNSSGVRYVSIFKNGTIISRNWGFNPAAWRNTAARTTVLDLVANDYLEVSVFQNSGGNLDTATNQQEIDSSTFYAIYLGA